MNKRILSLFCALLLSASFAVPAYAAGPASPQSGKAAIIDKFSKQSGGSFEYYENGTRLFLSGKLSGKRNSTDGDAKSFLEANKALFGLHGSSLDGGNTAGFFTQRVSKDENGDTFVLLNQTLNGIKVQNKQINVHYDSNGEIISINGDYQQEQEIAALDGAGITEEQAIETAKAQFLFNELKIPPAAEKIILPKDGKLYETYKVNIYYLDPQAANFDVFIETHSGQVLQISDNMRFDGPAAATGTGVNGETKNLNAYLYQGNYYLIDVTKTAPTEIRTYDLRNGTSSGYSIYSPTPVFNTEVFKAGVSAHYNAGIVYDFYWDIFGRNSIDGNGMTVNSYVHYSTNYNNAGWTGYEMIYGDGDGIKFTYLSGDLDVVGHEITHGVIDRTANLTYENQSGALNESMADVFGVLIETFDKYDVQSNGTSAWSYNSGDWVVGDEIYTPAIPGDALRSLVDPTLRNQPAHMDDYIVTTEDHGGVHINSGIPNKAAQLVASSIGLEKTARIYYKALTSYMTASTDFAQGYNCIREAAADLYGENGTETAAVTQAFYDVGITSEGVFDVGGNTLKFDTESGFVTGFCGSPQKLVIPSSIGGVTVTGIGDGAFSGCTSLKEITLPSGAVSIGSNAFYGCTGLVALALPSGVLSIGAGAYAGCTELRSIAIPSSVFAIGTGAFSNCPLVILYGNNGSTAQSYAAANSLSFLLAPAPAGLASAQRAAKSGLAGGKDFLGTSSLSADYFAEYTLLEVGTLVIKSATLGADVLDIVNIKASRVVSGYLNNSNPSVYTFIAAVWDIPSEAAGQSIVTRAYVKYYDGGSEKYAYGPVMSYTILA